MVKKQVMLNLDHDIFQQFQDYMGKGNVSSKVQELMNKSICLENQDYKSIDLQLLKTQVTRLEKKKDKLFTELSNKQILISKIEEDIELEKEKALRKEKEIIEQSKKCIMTGKELFDSGFETTPDGLVSKEAYLNIATPEMRRKWEAGEKTLRLDK